MEPQNLATVERSVESLRSLQRSSIAALEGKFLGGEPARKGAEHLRQLSSVIDPWAERGLSAARNNTTPGAKGWSAWVEAGRRLEAGINSITGLGLTANLENISDAAAAAPAEAAKAVTKAARKVVSEATSIVGDGATNLLRPLIMPLVLVAVVVTGVLVVRARSSS